MLLFSNLLLFYIIFLSYSTSFWDIVVITARDDAQKEIYEHQIRLKKERKEVPLFVQ